MKKIIAIFALLFVSYLSANASYSNSADFLKAEGNTCKVATDGCNTISIIDGKLGASTMMYCEDIYGNGATEKWSCKDEIKLGGDRDEHGCIGSAGYSWNEEKGECVRPWEETQTKDVETSICTMDYRPVCAKVQVQCIASPCLPIAQTFGNACSAGKNEILYSGECDEYVDITLFSKLKAKYPNLGKQIEKTNNTILQKAIQKADKFIANTKLLRIVRQMQVSKITKLYFMKTIIENELNSRN